MLQKIVKKNPYFTQNKKGTKTVKTTCRPCFRKARRDYLDFDTSPTLPQLFCSFSCYYLLLLERSFQVSCRRSDYDIIIRIIIREKRFVVRHFNVGRFCGWSYVKSFEKNRFTSFLPLQYFFSFTVVVVLRIRLIQFIGFKFVPFFHFIASNLYIFFNICLITKVSLSASLYYSVTFLSFSPKT